MASGLSTTVGFDLAAACLREGLPLVEEQEGKADASTIAAAVQAAAHMSSLCRGGSVAQMAFAAVDSDIIELLAKYLSYLSRWQRPYYSERAAIYEAKVRNNSSSSSSAASPAGSSSSSSSSSGKPRFKYQPLSVSNRNTWTYGLHIMAQHIRTAAAIASGEVPADPEMYSEVGRMLVHVLKDVMGPVDEEPVAWLADTAAALSRLLQYQRPQQLLLEATALLDVYCSLMQAQLAVANNYTSWPAYTAAGLGPMIQFALALLQPTQGSRPSGAVEKVLTELSQAYFKIRYHPIVAPTYSQALALTLEKQPEAEDSEDEGEGGEVQTAVPPPRPPVPGMWSVYNCQDPAQRLCWSALTGICTALAHAEQQQQKQKQAQAKGSSQQQQQQQQKPGQANGITHQRQQEEDPQQKGQTHKEEPAQPSPSKQHQQHAPAQPARRKGWPIVSVQQRLPCPKERRLMQGNATLVELTHAEGQSLLKAAAGALLGHTLWVVWPAVVRDMVAVRYTMEKPNDEWVEPRPSPAAAAAGGSSDGVGSDADAGSEDTLHSARSEEGSEDAFAGVGDPAAAGQEGAGAGGVGFLKGALSTAAAGIKALGTVLTRAASGGMQGLEGPASPGNGSSSSISSIGPHMWVKLVPYKPPHDAVVWCTALEVPFCPCCSNRMGATEVDAANEKQDGKEQPKQQQKQQQGSPAKHAGKKDGTAAAEAAQQGAEAAGSSSSSKQEASAAAVHGASSAPPPDAPMTGAGQNAGAASGAAAAVEAGGSSQQAVQQPCAAATTAVAAAAAAPRRRAAGASNSSSSSSRDHDKHGPRPAAEALDGVVNRQAAIAKQLSTIRFSHKLPYPRPGDLIWPHLPGTSAAWLVTQANMVPPLGPPEQVTARLRLLLEASVRQSKVDLKQCSTPLLLLAVTLLRAQEEVRQEFLGGVQGQVLLQLLLVIVQTCGIDDPGSISYRAAYYGSLGACTPSVMMTAVENIPAKVLAWGVHHTELGGPTAVLLLLTWCLLVPRSDWPPLPAGDSPGSTSSSREGGGHVDGEHEDGSGSDESDGYDPGSDGDSSSSDGGGGGGGLPPPRPPCPHVDLASCLHHGFILSEATSDHHLVALSVPSSHFELASDVPRSPLLLLLLEALLRRCPTGVYPCTAVTRLLLGYLEGPAWVHCSAAELAPLPSLLVTLSKRLGEVLLAPGVSVLELLGDCLTVVQRVVVGSVGLQLARPSEAEVQRSLLGAAARLLLVVTRGLQQQLPERMVLEAADTTPSQQPQQQGKEPGVQAASEEGADMASRADAPSGDSSSSSSCVMEAGVASLLPYEFYPDGRLAITPALYAVVGSPSSRNGQSHAAQAAAATTATTAAAAAAGATAAPAAGAPSFQAVEQVRQYQEQKEFLQRQRQYSVLSRAAAGGCDPAALTLLSGVLEALLVIPPALGMLLQPSWLLSSGPSIWGITTAGSSSSSCGDNSSNNASSGSSSSGAAARVLAAAGSPDGPHTPEHVQQVLGAKLRTLEGFLTHTPDFLLAGLPSGVTTLGSLLAAVEAAALRVTQRLAPGAWCGALGCVNMAGCSEAELVAGRQRVVCGCCGVVSYCSPACLAADVAAGRLKHHRSLPGVGRHLDMCD